MTIQRFKGYGGKELRIAMLGMVDGNGHPYSWSAIFNGYDPAEMARCPFPGIPEYLDKEPKENFGLDGARVSHIWTDDPEDAPRVARAALIPHVVDRPEDVIGQVDAVIVATDKGHEHVARCRPFVEAGLPVFLDKPLVDNAPDLAVFRQWEAEGRPILSGSALAYAKEFLPWRISTHDLGDLRHICITTAKSWERYGIHALSAVYPIAGPGFISARNTGTPGRDIVHFTHQRQIDVTVVAIDDMYGAFACMQLCGTKGAVQSRFNDTFYAFKAQLSDFVHFLRSGERPFPWAESEELMRMIIAGIWSRDKGGREVHLEEIP
jgi:hypothetical protein